MYGKLFLDEDNFDFALLSIWMYPGSICEMKDAFQGPALLDSVKPRAFPPSGFYKPNRDLAPPSTVSLPWKTAATWAGNAITFGVRLDADVG